jgi:CBS domain-containing protein
MPPLDGAIEFFTAYVERCHEAKEEEALMPVLAGYGILDAEALRAIRGEHDEGRRLLQALRPFCGRRAMESAAGSLLRSYVVLQRRHMAFEETSVLGPADRTLGASDDARVQEEFDRIDERVVGHGGKGTLLALGDAVTHAWHALGAGGPRELPALTARDLLHPPQGTIGPGDSLARAGALMESLGARELGVVEGGALVGILTRTDLEPHRGHWEWTPVRTAMTSDPVHVAPDAPIRAVAEVLLEHGFNSVPVVAEGRLLGIARRSDFVRVLAAS